MHAPADVRPAEKLVADVYSALQSHLDVWTRCNAKYFRVRYTLGSRSELRTRDIQDSEQAKQFIRTQMTKNLEHYFGAKGAPAGGFGHESGQ